MEAVRERTLVGLFVLIAGGLLLGTMVVISGGLGGATVSHQAYFKFAGGVQTGAPVRYGGMMVGKVDRVRVDPGNTTRIEIDVTVRRDAPLKTDSVAKISTLGPLTDNYIEITTGSEHAALAAPGSTLLSAEAFGLPQLGDAAQAMMPDVHMAIQKLNQNLDGLQVTLSRANDLLNDHNRANIAGALNGVDRMVAEVRPKANDSLDNLNGMLTETRPKVAASLSNVQDLTTRLRPLLDSLNTTTARANDTLGHLDSTLMENRPDVRAAVTGLRDTLAKSTGLLTELNQTLDQNSANIDDLLDNIRMSTENLRTLTETLMHSPASLIRGIKVPDRKPGDVRK
ncbi:MAG TPA: MlaD family protein [Candidatus Acidoferrales bacterium]|jgi:phospholipid/cholesterol/gamma-HCH transport system substrate-binding protein|nr:MlaD family protein [Candidatus Acidoferrales bacterium]